MCVCVCSEHSMSVHPIPQGCKGSVQVKGGGRGFCPQVVLDFGTWLKLQKWLDFL